MSSSGMEGVLGTAGVEGSASIVVLVSSRRSAVSGTNVCNWFHQGVQFCRVQEDFLEVQPLI